MKYECIVSLLLALHHLSITDADEGGAIVVQSRYSTVTPSSTVFSINNSLKITWSAFPIYSTK